MQQRCSRRTERTCKKTTDGISHEYNLLIGRIEEENAFDGESNEFCLLLENAAEESREFLVEIDGEEIQ